MKALQQDEKRANQIADIERKRAETLPEQIAKHKQGFTERKKDFTALRREEKAAKRGVNIEICSEVIDLIMDIANEAYDESKKKAGNSSKLDKPMWREWMRYFKDGKLVSKARKGLLDQDQDSLFMMRPESNISEGNYEILEDLKRPIDEVLEAVKDEQCHSDMLEYMTATGIFNLADGNRFREWSEFSDILSSQTTLDSSVLEQPVPPPNPNLGAHLLKYLNKENASSTSKSLHAEGVPSYLNLKLCILGRSCAGKRTLAKQLQELYPKVKAFRMDELIKEAVEYVNPKPVADAAAT